MIVYTHTRNDTDQIFYVGIGKTTRRAYSIKSRNNHWKGIVNKHGHQVQIVHECESWEEAQYTEKYLIGYYGRHDLNLGSLCNQTGGGDGSIGCTFWIGRKHTEESKKKMAESTKGQVAWNKGKKGVDPSWKKRKKGVQVAWNKGIPMSEEQKMKLSESKKGRIPWNKGKQMTDEYKAKVGASSKGRIHSPETRAKISASLKRRGSSDTPI